MKPFSLVLLLLLSTVSGAQAQPTYAGSVHVTAGPDPVANGEELLSALDSRPIALSETDLWLIRIDAGTYDLGDRQIVPPSQTHLEGAGIGGTVLLTRRAGTTTADGAVNVPSGVATELRDLTIANHPSSGDGIGLQNFSDDLSLVRVEIEVMGVFESVALRHASGMAQYTDLALSSVPSAYGPAFAFRGLAITGGTPSFDGLIIRSTALAASVPEAIYATGGSSVIQDLSIQVAGDGVSTGIIVAGLADLAVTDATLDVSSSWRSTGIDLSNRGTAYLERVQVASTGGTSMACGISVANLASVTALDSVFGASGIGGGHGLCNRARSTLSTSLVAGSSSAVLSDDSAAVAEFDGGTLDGGVLLQAGTVTCTATRDGQGMVLDAACN